MQKRIAFFISSLNPGGVERAFVTLANTLIEGGHEVDFIVCHYTGELKGALNSKIKVVDFDNSRLRNTFFKLHTYLRNSTVDCLISGPTYPNVIALITSLFCFKRIKIIVSQHSYQDVEMKNLGLIGKLAPFFIRSTYNRAHKVVAVSNGVRKDLIENYNIKPDKVVMIYNAVLDKSFYKKSYETLDGALVEMLPSKPYLVAVGRLEIVKNYSFMLKAYASLKNRSTGFDYDLVILGDGNEMENLVFEANSLGISDSVYFIGNVSNPLPIIKNSEMLVHTSFSESMGLVYVEALALKVPVVTVTNMGAQEILKDIEQKVIVDSHDIEKFSDGIEQILRQEYSLNFPELKEFNSGNIASKFLSLI
jgi:glycosyltransferase involved in cell wall biosynthesis